MKTGDKQSQTEKLARESPERAPADPAQYLTLDHFESATELLPSDQSNQNDYQSMAAGSLIDRYRILAPLGRGGMGEVYLAEDSLLRRKVAVKSLPSQFVNDQNRLRRFIQEARAASALNHPNITTIYDVVDIDAGWYLIMELIQGRTLRELIRESTPLEAVAKIGAQAARALAAAHGAGIVHRDIKPENIMCREDGYVKVLDFGLARLIGRIDDNSTITDPGIILGTIAYMSPEQTRCETLGGASDIFSLGVVLYELATRRHPFVTSSRGGILEAIASVEPIPPSRLNPEVPASLDELILKMLEKDHRLRPTGAEVDAALSQLTVGSARISERPETAKLRRKRSTVGRARERAELRAAFEQTASGQSLMMSVSGEPGIGKTTLIEDFIAELIEDNTRCSIGRGRSSERLAGTEAYMPLLEAFDSLIRGESGHDVARAMRVFAPTWYGEVTPLSTGESSPAQSNEPRAASQERLKRELSALLEELSRARPLILFFDDLHWADASTIELLSYLSTRFETLRLLVIVTYRPSEILVTRHPFRQVKLDLQGRGLCRELPLDFLSREEVESYLEKEFPGNRLPLEFSALIYAKTEGNPLFMVDLLGYLRDRKVIAQQEDGHWALVESIPQIELDLPESVRSLIHRKLDSLSEQNRRLLIGASVQGYEFDSTVLSEALDLEAADVEEHLDELDRTHALVRQIEEWELPDRTPTLRYRFVHALYQNSFYGMLKPTRRASLSGKVAEALLNHYREEDAADIASELGFLFETARDYKRASDYFVLAAQKAVELFANQEAATLAQRGLNLIEALPDGPERNQKELMAQMSLGVSLAQMKGFAAPEVERTYNRARELCQQMGEDSHLFRILYGLWSVYQLRADFKTADELARQLLRMAQGAEDKSLLLRAHYARGFTLDYVGDHREARRHYTEVLAHYDMQDDLANTYAYGTDAGLLTESRLAWILFVLGYVDQARSMTDECVNDARKRTHLFSSTCALLSMPQLCQEFGDLERARNLSEEVIAICIEYCFPLIHAYASLHHGWAIGRLGRLEEGISEMRNSFGALGAMGADMSWTGYYVPLAELLAEARRFDESLKAVEEGLTRVNKTGERFFEAELFRARGDVLSSMIIDCDDSRNSFEHLSNQPAKVEGLIREAEESYLKAVEIARQRGAISHELRAAIGLGRLWERQGDRARAHELLARVYGSFVEGFESPDLKSARELLSRPA